MRSGPAFRSGEAGADPGAQAHQENADGEEAPDGGHLVGVVGEQAGEHGTGEGMEEDETPGTVGERQEKNDEHVGMKQGGAGVEGSLYGDEQTIIGGFARRYATRRRPCRALRRKEPCRVGSCTR